MTDKGCDTCGHRERRIWTREDGTRRLETVVCPHWRTMSENAVVRASSRGCARWEEGGPRTVDMGVLQEKGTRRGIHAFMRRDWFTCDTCGYS